MPVERTHDPSTDLIPAGELATALAGPRPPTVLDVRWSITGGGDPVGFSAGHIPGSQFVDLDADLAGPAGRLGRHPLPEPDVLQRTWRRLGLNDGDAVVVLDAADSTAAVRAWWLLRWSGLTRVAVLDGGLSQWTGHLEHGEPAAPDPGTVTVRPGGMPTADIDDAAAAGGTGVLVDVRAADRFSGAAEPTDPRAGHIPGSVNLPYARLYRPDGTLHDRAELRDLLTTAGIRPGRPAVTSCGSGVSACHLILAGRVVGMDVALFPGSWSQWCTTDRSVATGPVDSA